MRRSLSDSMRRNRRAIIAVALLSIIAFAGPPLMVVVAERYIGELQRRGIKISVDNLSGHLTGVSTSRASVWLAVPLQGSKAAIPVTLELARVKVSLGFSSSPFQAPVVRFSATMYGGDVAGSVTRVWGSPSLDLQVRDVDLSQHPQLRPAGLQAGLISARIEHLPLGTTSPQTTSLWVSLKNGSFAAPPTVSNLLNISALSDTNFETSAVLRDNGLFNFGPVTLDSSLVKVTGDGRGRLGMTKNLIQLSSLFHVQLVGPDAERVAQWLPLLTDSQLDSSHTSFSFALQDSLCTSKSLVFRVGSTCLKTQFGGQQ